MSKIHALRLKYGMSCVRNQMRASDGGGYCCSCAKHTASQTAKGNEIAIQLQREAAGLSHCVPAAIARQAERNAIANTSLGAQTSIGGTVQPSASYPKDCSSNIQPDIFPATPFSNALIKYGADGAERQPFDMDLPWVTPAVRSVVAAIDGLQEKSASVKLELVKQLITAADGANADSSGTKVAVVMACRFAIKELVKTTAAAMDTFDGGVRDLDDSAQGFVQDLLGQVYLGAKDEIVSSSMSAANESDPDNGGLGDN